MNYFQKIKRVSLVALCLFSIGCNEKSSPIPEPATPPESPEAIEQPKETASVGAQETPPPATEQNQEELLNKINQMSQQISDLQKTLNESTTSNTETISNLQ